MNKLNFLRMFFMAVTCIGVLAMFSACNTECETLDCGAHGDCKVVGGVANCECDSGYSGEFCDTFDPCWNIECPDNATCEDDDGDGVADCFCDPGYEGDSCQLLIRDKYLGFYNSNETCVPGGSGSSFELNYELEISADGNDITRIYLKGLGDFATPQFTPNTPYATLLDDIHFSIPKQDIDPDPNAELWIESTTTGTFSIGSISQKPVIGIEYKATYDDGDFDVCTMAADHK